jgi:hypothetical protein
MRPKEYMSVAVVMRPVSSSSLGMYTIVPAKAQAAETEGAVSEKEVDLKDHTHMHSKHSHQ